MLAFHNFQIVIVQTAIEMVNLHALILQNVIIFEYVSIKTRLLNRYEKRMAQYYSSSKIYLNKSIYYRYIVSVKVPM